jgi:RNA ligase
MPFVKEETRALARIVKIDEIKPIKKADRLEIAVVGGWECVVAKDLYRTGDLAVYFEIDAAVPLNSPVWGDFDKKYLLVKKDVENGEKEYAVIKTLKLRSTLSQGLLMQIKNLDYLGDKMAALTPDMDITRDLDVMKYVNPVEYKQYLRRLAEESGADGGRGTNSWWWKLRMRLIKGILVDGLQDFPRGHVKSDEERVQNLKKEYDKLVREGDDWEGSVKLDGESAMVYQDLDNGSAGLAQRNFSLRTEAVPYTRKESFRVYLSDWMRFVPRRLRGGACPVPTWKTEYDPKCVPLVRWMINNDIPIKLKALNKALMMDVSIAKGIGLEFAHGKIVAVQGEMVGPSFNGGAEGFPVNQFFVYRAYGNGSYRFTPDETKAIAKYLGLTYIPVDPKLERVKLPAEMKDLLKWADGPTALWENPAKDAPEKLREGLVMKNHVTGQSFKVISNKWLENQPLEEEETEAETI